MKDHRKEREHHQLRYNAAGNPVTITPPAPLVVVTNTFDAARRTATVKDGKNQTATYTYDNNDRITEVRYGASCVTATCVAYTSELTGYAIWL